MILVALRSFLPPMRRAISRGKCCSSMAGFSPIKCPGALSRECRPDTATSTIAGSPVPPLEEQRTQGRRQDRVAERDHQVLRLLSDHGHQDVEGSGGGGRHPPPGGSRIVSGRSPLGGRALPRRLLL